MFNRIANYVLVMTLLLWGGSLCFAEQTLLNENGGFETGDTSGWEFSGVTKELVSGEEALFGLYSVHLSDIVTDNPWSAQARVLAGYTFEKDKVYTFSCFIKTEPFTTRTLSMRFQELNTWAVFPAKTITITDEWAEYYITTETLPRTYTPARAGWEFGTSAEEIWFDVAKVYEGEYEETVLIDPPEAILMAPADGDDDVAPVGTVLTWAPGGSATEHDVYFGEDYDAVNNAVVGDATYKGRQPETSYPLDELALEATYFWRIDEVNDATAGSPWKGAVSSFTTEAVAYALDGALIAVSVSSQDTPEADPNAVVNGAGLDVNDLHDVLKTDMWLSSADDAEPWIRFDFGKAYPLYEMKIWNHNSDSEDILGHGIKEARIEFLDSNDVWQNVVASTILNQAPGTDGYAANTTLSLNGVTTQALRMTALSSWSQYPEIFPEKGLSEVQFSYIPVFARSPEPATRSQDVAPDLTLSWRQGRGAKQHDVYLGLAPDALELVGSPVENQLSTDSLDLLLGQTYTWQVVEVTDTASSPSDAWTFTTADHLVVDDMESYTNADDSLIFNFWVDGWDDTANNGALVGTDPDQDDYSPEREIVHTGRQSLPIHYDNTGAPRSEAEQTFTPAQNWTRHGVQDLVLYFHGDSTNTGGSLYVKINDVKIPYSGDAADLTSDGWSDKWTISLDEIGTDLSQVTSMTIGIDNGGQGVVYVDDIQLEPEPKAVVNGYLILPDPDFGDFPVHEVCDGGCAGDGAMPITRMTVTDVAPGTDSASAYMYTWTYPGCAEGGQWSQVSQGKVDAGTDVSSAQAVTFWAKGTDGAKVTLRMFSAGPHANWLQNGSGQDFWLTPVWTKYTLPLAKFTKLGWLAEACDFSSLVAAPQISIWYGADTPVGTVFELYIDEMVVGEEFLVNGD